MNIAKGRSAADRAKFHSFWRFQMSEEWGWGDSSFFFHVIRSPRWLNYSKYRKTNYTKLHLRIWSSIKMQSVWKILMLTLSKKCFHKLWIRVYFAFFVAHICWTNQNMRRKKYACIDQHMFLFKMMSSV